MRMKDMEVYKKSKKLLITIYKLEFPKEEIYMLRSQMIRAGHSIMLNLCEGSAYRDKNKNKHYKIALGSAYECESCFEIYEEVIGKLPPEIFIMLDEISRMIFKLSEKDYCSDTQAPAHTRR